jgi:hypothetical protein
MGYVRGYTFNKHPASARVTLLLAKVGLHFPVSIQIMSDNRTSPIFTKLWTGIGLRIVSEVWQHPKVRRIAFHIAQPEIREFLEPLNEPILSLRRKTART